MYFSSVLFFLSFLFLLFAIDVVRLVLDSRWCIWRAYDINCSRNQRTRIVTVSRVPSRAPANRAQGAALIPRPVAHHHTFMFEGYRATPSCCGMRLLGLK